MKDTECRSVSELLEYYSEMFRLVRPCANIPKDIKSITEDDYWELRQAYEWKRSAEGVDASY